MKAVYTILSALFFSMIISVKGNAQNEWPKTLTTPDGDLIKVYQWQPESLTNGTLQANAAISVLEKDKNDPVFGMIWFTADADKNGQQVNIRSIAVNAIKLPDEGNESRLNNLKQVIGDAMTGWNLSLASSEINDALQLSQKEEKLSNSINNNPPTIIYSDKPSLLVVIDGAPKVQKNEKLGVDAVVNTPFNIIRYNNKYYLFGGKHWYIANAATGPYAITTSIPSNLSAIEAEILQANKENNVQQEDNDYVIYNIIVTTEPAELLQSNGEPNFTPIQNTNLLFVKNSENDIFMDVTGQQYYVLLSGRWYRSSALKGKWQYIAPDKLPTDFAKIPEGSPKDNVLSSVAGTVAARDAVMNAQVPQTAKVDRRSANADIQYDGDPRFESIDGTDMDYAINTNGYVIRWRGGYYAVDNGVWFRANSARGPWIVAVERPYIVSLIPPRYPVYAMKYVYVYDVTPDFVYMGYTPGYLNTYVYGPTVVYGTGYYYRPWFGNYYYARPYTWGFNMHYNPWTGWGFGFNYNFGWFNTGWGNYNYWGWGGWWGPSVYRPAYCWTPYRNGYHHGYYGGGYYGRSRNTVIINNNINIYRNNNIYNTRRDVVTRDVRRTVSSSRGVQSAPVRRFDDTRQAGRNPVRNGNNSGRPSVVHENNSNGGRSPRSTSGTRFEPNTTNRENNPAGTRPSRSFGSGNNTNGRVTTPSQNNERQQPPVRRQLAEQQPSFTPRQQAPASPPAGNRQFTPRSEPRIQRNDAPSVNRQPVQRSFEPARPSAPQRVERSSGGNSDNSRNSSEGRAPRRG
ncbi:MAG: hypothetical protein KF746_25525 [Chitinophagaceae bacterium]|nr:hypothetical protein [Chitinophagaceae bacterium]